ncbi:MAG: Na/Pi cotransporter family protein [Ruminococcaceae bacterium]|nr:Na/Pi cotransporter family protein [Oscillospiraceae bacterium]
MGIFEILTLLCGLALFLYGMDVMGDALKKSAGRKLKTILGDLTSNKFKGFLLGLGVTAIIQSSSATTVMVVGFVNSGTMLLGQAVGVIMGANVGTAVTAWITALNGIEGGADATAILKWLKPEAWMPILAIIGICLLMFSKKNKLKDVGTILLGFAVLMTGMDIMSGAVSGLKNDPGFCQILTLFENPLLGVLAGTILTAVVQSSSASIGILQALAVGTGAISFGAAIPIILGQNIGTCITAMLSALGANKNGKRAAFVHLYFNIIGVAFWLTMYYLVGWIFSLTGAFDLFGLANTTMIDMWGIAIVHTVFKILSVITLFPFTKLLEKLACLTVRGSDKKGDEYTNMLDERLLDTPTVAIDRSRAVAAQMAVISMDSFKKSMQILDSYDSKIADEIRKEEDTADIYEDELGSYLVKLSERNMDAVDSHEVTKLLHMIGDFERISDHAVNLLESAEELKDKSLSFSKQAQHELHALTGAVEEILTITKEAFVESDMNKAAMVEPLEQVVDYLKDQIRFHHTLRLQKSECTIEHGFVLADILTNLERVSDHCSNIAGCLIEMSRHDALGVHEYLHEVKAGSPEFTKLYNGFLEKYSIEE